MSNNQPRRPISASARKALFERFGSKCAMCGATGAPLDVAHILPTASGGTDDDSNLTLLCANCNRSFDRGGISELEFISYLAKLIEGNHHFENTQVEAAIGESRRYRADITTVKRRKGKTQTVLVECKNYAFLNGRRIREAIDQISRYREVAPFDSSALAFPGRLSESATDEIKAAGIDVWDVDSLQASSKSRFENILIRISLLSSLEFSRPPNPPKRICSCRAWLHAFLVSSTGWSIKSWWVKRFNIFSVRHWNPRYRNRVMGLPLIGGIGSFRITRTPASGISCDRCTKPTTSL